MDPIKPLSLTFLDENCFTKAGDNVEKEEGEHKERSHWRRSEEVEDLGQLLDAMDAEDKERGFTNDKAEDVEGDEENEENGGFDEDAKFNSFAKKVVDDYIAFDTLYGYRLNQRRFLKYLFILSKRQTPSGKRAISLIDPQLYNSTNK